MSGGLIEDPRQQALPLVGPRGVDLVAFWSPAPQSGKSTAAAWFEGIACPTAWRRLSFAAPVRNIAFYLATSFGEDAYVAWPAIMGGVRKEDPLPRLGKSAVDWLMLVGTKLGRGFVGPDVWVDMAQNELTALRDGGSCVVVDDMRFPNERDMVRRNGGVLVGIRRPGATVSAARAAAEGLLSFDDMDAVIDNDGTIEEFEAKIVETVRRLGVRV